MGITTVLRILLTGTSASVVNVDVAVPLADDKTKRLIKSSIPLLAGQTTTVTIPKVGR